MRISKLFSCFGIISFTFMLSQVVLADTPPDKIKIASYVAVEIGGDIGQYEETLSANRNQTRKMYMDEIVDAAVKLSAGVFDPTAMLEPLQKIQEAADQKRDINKAIDSYRVGYSVGEFIKAEIEKLHKINRIVSSERRIEFINQFPIINGKMIYNSKAQFDHYLFAQMAHIGGGQFRISATLGSISDGVERTYEGSGYLGNALTQISESIFRSIMEPEKPQWNNPNPQLVWIPGPTNSAGLSIKEARTYCAGQNARLPLADELMGAQQATAFRHGGIEQFKEGETYIVGDQLRQAAVPVVIRFVSNSSDGIPSAQIGTGQVGKVWCVY